MILYVYNSSNYSHSTHKGYLDIKYDLLGIIIYITSMFFLPQTLTPPRLIFAIVPIYNDIILFYFVYTLYLYNRVNLEKSS